MKVLLLCGGRGVIDPITSERIPKCLIRVGNRPLIWHIMKLYSSFGYNDFVLALGQDGEKIKQYFINGFELLHDIEVNFEDQKINPLNKIPEENWKIKLIDTGISANTGSRVSRCERYLKYEPFFISYSDILADVNIKELLKFHDAQNKVLTITGVNPPTRFGTFYFNEQSNDSISYKSDAKLNMLDSRINGGFMVASEKIFDKLSPISECNLEKEVFDDLIAENEISIWKHDSFWQNVDTERDLELLQEFYTINKRPWLGIN